LGAFWITKMNTDPEGLTSSQWKALPEMAKCYGAITMNRSILAEPFINNLTERQIKVVRKKLADDVDRYQKQYAELFGPLPR
jgi:hypothetical protein